MKRGKSFIVIWRNATAEFEEVFSLSPFSLDKEEKGRLFSEKLRQLTVLHYEKCEAYKRIIDAIGISPYRIAPYHEIPFIPVSLFKQLDLMSMDRNQIFKTMTSSGTTGQAVSKIFLDKKTAVNQQKTLVKIVSDFSGSSRNQG
jgi:phenylacetate-coenzyme A ligase PaaK-like adenylate-forming protein